MTFVKGRRHACCGGGFGILRRPLLVAAVVGLASCHREDTSQTNAAGAGNAPLSAAEVWGGQYWTENGHLNGVFQLTDQRLAGIRAALAKVNPSATITIDPAATEKAVQLRFMFTPEGHADALRTLFSYYPPEGMPNDPFDPSDPSHALVATLADQILPGSPFDSLAGLVHVAGPFTLNVTIDPNSLSVDQPEGHPKGVYLNIGVDFPQPWFTSHFSCDCDTWDENGVFAVSPVDDPVLPSGGCDTLCKRIWDESWDDHAQMHYSPDVWIVTRINHLQLRLGLIPTMPSTSKNGPSWTAQMFPPASKDFHLPQMFDTEVEVVGSLLKINVPYGDDEEAFAAVVVNGVDDLAVAAHTSTIWTGEGTDYTVGQGVADAIATALRNQLPPPFKDRIDPILNFKGPLPAKCPLLGPAFETRCTDAQILTLASASITYQKWDWFAGVFGPYPNGGWLPILAVVPTTPSGGLHSMTFTYDADLDGDGIATPSDNCPFLANADQSDLDGDGRGDVCDPYPCDPNDDIDHDGVPALAFDAQSGTCVPLDSCPNVANPRQLNCNSDAEKAALASVLGDACDPVPCADQITLDNYDLKTCLVCPPCQLCNPGAGPLPCCPDGCMPGLDITVTEKCGKVLHNSIGLLPLESSSNKVPPTPPAFVPPSPIGTLGMFCQKQPLSGISCEDPIYGDFRDRDRLEDSQCASQSKDCFDAEAKSDHYHRVLLAGSQKPDTIHTLKYDIAPETDFDSLDAAKQKSLTWTWQYTKDYTRWVKAPALIDDPGSAAGLYGGFWTYAVTNVGDSTHDIGGTGTHADDIAGHHNLGVVGEGFSPEEAVGLMCVRPLLLDVAPAPPPLPQPNGLPGPFAPTAAQVLVWRTQAKPAVGAFYSLGQNRGEAALVFAASATVPVVLSGAPGCGAQAVTGRIGSHLMARLQDPSLVLANAVEPLLAQGGMLDFPSAVFLPPDGHTIVDTVHTDGVSLLADADRWTAPPVTHGSPHATGFIPVLTQTAHGVFVVGGQSPETGLPTGEIWFLPSGGEVWARVLTAATGYTPGRVLAATYSFASRELIVLDESGTDARLVAIEPARMTARVIGTWPRHAAWDRQWLVVDRDGALLLASSSASLKKHAVARIDLRNGGNQVDGIASGRKAFVLPILVDGSGYTLVLRKGQGAVKGKDDDGHDGKCDDDEDDKGHGDAKGKDDEPHHESCDDDDGKNHLIGQVKRRRIAALPLKPATLAEVGSFL